MLAACVLLLAAKLVLASKLSLFGDEAFYWWESRHLAWSYSDLPGFTQWMIALSEWLFGSHYFGVRALSQFGGVLMPLTMLAIARALDAPRALQGAAIVGFFLLPLTGGLGLLALPDTWLNLFALAAAGFALRALKSNALRDFLALGACLAAGLATHPRFVVWIAAMVPFLLFNPHGRRWWRNTGFWLAAAIGLLGLLPTVWFNVHHAYENLQFQLLDRHPWRFSWEGLQFFPEQLLFTAPPTALLLLAVFWSARRQPDPRLQLLVSLALTHWLFYALLAPFSDRERLSVHWTLPSYLLLLAALPVVLANWRRQWLVLTACWVSLLLSAALLAVLAFGALGRDGKAHFASKWLPENFVGWREAAGLYQVVLPSSPPEATLVADNFMVAAQLAFELKRPEDVFVLDHPLNAKHGRALQLAIWQRNGVAAAARARAGSVLLISELSASKRDQLPAWVAGFCPTLGPLALISDFTLIAERKRIAVFRTAPSGCELPAIGYVGVRDGRVEGWHWRNAQHITGFELWLESAAGARLLHTIPVGPSSAEFVATPFSFDVPASTGDVTLRATYAGGGAVVIAADTLK